MYLKDHGIPKVSVERAFEIVDLIMIITDSSLMNSSAKLPLK
jgi:hypothetical protein